MKGILLGQVAFITGGTAGIGKAVALAFARQGAHVIIVGTNQQRGDLCLQELEKERIQEGQQFLFQQVDVGNKQAVDEAVQQVLSIHGHVDIVVNNAGITRDTLLVRMKEEQWDEVLRSNLKSVYNVCQAFARPMMKASRGSIIMVSSVVALTGNAGQVNYAASKAGMIGFTKSLAKELASRSIRVNCIAPGYIETKMTEVLSEKVKEEILKQIPMGHIGQPEDVASLALFLASDHSRYLTGQVIAVDGGMAM